MEAHLATVFVLVTQFDLNLVPKKNLALLKFTKERRAVVGWVCIEWNLILHVECLLKGGGCL